MVLFLGIISLLLALAVLGAGVWLWHIGSREGSWLLRAAAAVLVAGAIAGAIATRRGWSTFERNGDMAHGFAPNPMQERMERLRDNADRAGRGAHPGMPADRDERPRPGPRFDREDRGERPPRPDRYDDMGERERPERPERPDRRDPYGDRDER